MYEKGSLIIYGNTGVCRIEDVGAPPDNSIFNKSNQFYKLTPVHGKGIIYIPVDTTVFMRPLITKKEAAELIENVPNIHENNCHDQRLLTEHYRAALQTHDCENLVRLIKTVYIRSKTLSQNGKKTGKADLEYKKRAEELLYGELSVALDIPYSNIQSYIEQGFFISESQ